MGQGGDVKDVFARFCAMSNAVKTSAEGAVAALMWNETHGFMGSCPSNIGTGLRGSVMIKLPKLNENIELLGRRALRRRRCQVGRVQQAAHRLLRGAAGAE